MAVSALSSAVGPVPGGRRPNVVLIDSSPEKAAHTVVPIEAAGASCTAVTNLPAALKRIEADRPVMVIVSADDLSLGGELTCGMIRRQGQGRRVPVVLLASSSTQSDVIESCFRAGLDDCILRPLSKRHIETRLALLVAPPVGGAPVPARPSRLIAVVHDGGVVAERAVELLTLSGYRVLAEETGGGVGKAEPFDALVVIGARSAPSALLGAAQARKVPVLCVGVDARNLPEGAELVASLAPESLLGALAAKFHQVPTNLRVANRIPLFVPVEFREVSSDPQPWSSAFSFDISPGGIFLRTMVPARKGACLDLKLHLTICGEILDGSGVVAWSNAYTSPATFSHPVGMGVQFLGMSPSRLAHLRRLCESLAADTAVSGGAR